MTTTTTDEAPSRWRFVAALSALLAVLGATAVLTADPRGLAQVGAGLLGATWLGLPYLLVIVLALTRQTAACGWTATVIGALFALVVVAAVMLVGRDALGFAAFFSGAIGIQALLVILAHAGLLTAGVRLVRRRDGPASVVLPVLATANLVAAGLVGVQMHGYQSSPQRAEKVAVERGVDAHGAMLQLHRCLVKFQRDRGAFPETLVELGPDGTQCAAGDLVTDRVEGYHFRYAVAADGQAYELLAQVRDPARSPYDHRRVDQSGAIWHSLDESGAGGTPDEDPTTTMQTLDICLEQYRQRFPARGYPASLAAADEELGCFFPGGLLALTEMGRSILEIGQFMGYRYQYTPGARDSQGVVRSFRLDLRPVQWGPAMKRSYLCTPEGTLHMTEEDRAAERTDADLQTDPVTGAVWRSGCMGPEVPALR